MPPIKIIIEEEPKIIEISPEEYEMIMRAREKQRRKTRQGELIAELNDLLAKINKEGFTVSTSKVSSLTKAEPWGDLNNGWIKVY